MIKLNDEAVNHIEIGTKQVKSEGFDSCDQPCNFAQIQSKYIISAHVILKFDKMTSKNNKEPLPCSLKLCVSIHSHFWIQIGVVIAKRWNRSQIMDFQPLCMTL